MNYVYCVKVKKSTLRSNEPISETRARRELHRLEEREVQVYDALSSIHKDFSSASKFANNLNNQMRFKRWSVSNGEGIKNDYYLETRIFYVTPYPIYE